MRMSSVGLDRRMREDVYVGVLFPLLDVVIRSALETRVLNIFARTRYLFVFAHAMVWPTFKIDWAPSDAHSWYQNEYRTADVCEVPPTHRSSGIYPASKPRARVGVKVEHFQNLGHV